MFIDSSALVAMIASEDEGEGLAHRLLLAPSLRTSPVVVFETVLALVRIFRSSIDQMLRLVLEFLERTGIRVVEVRADTYVTALQAHQRYGKGTGNPAQLNMGDCFSYAVAKTLGLAILYKGDDFAQTDMA